MKNLSGPLVWGMNVKLWIKKEVSETVVENELYAMAVYFCKDMIGIKNLGNQQSLEVNTSLWSMLSESKHL